MASFSRRLTFQRPSRIISQSFAVFRQASTMAPKVCHRLSLLQTQDQALTFLQLNDPSLLKQNVCYVNGEWVAASSGKTFKVTGKKNPPAQHNLHQPAQSSNLYYNKFNHPCTYRPSDRSRDWHMPRIHRQRHRFRHRRSSSIPHNIPHHNRPRTSPPPPSLVRTTPQQCRRYRDSDRLGEWQAFG